MPKLQITLQDGTEFAAELTEALVTVGRVPENSIELQDVSVSSRHAQLAASGADFILTDTGSTNGTRLNGRNLIAGEACPLQDGDTIRFGSVEAIYASENPSQAKSMPDAREAVAVAAESSVRPADFANASPFQTKKKKKEPAAVAVMAIAILAVVAFLGSAATAFLMKPPV